jgi:hypothetical protein
MSCCCKNIKDLGCVTSCGTVITGATASVTGDYTLYYEFLGVLHTILLPFAVGEPINFSSDNFNESAPVQFYLVDPNGQIVIFNENNIDYDCFRIRTVPIVST